MISKDLEQPLDGEGGLTGKPCKTGYGSRNKLCEKNLKFKKEN